MTGSLDNRSAESVAQIEGGGAFLAEIVEQVERVIVGQRSLVDGLLIGLLADGHVLLEGVPGLAKSLAVQAMATAVGGTFRRIQFTPDLLPSDVVGTQVYSPKTGEWTAHDGPVFANLVLADEINRAPAKVQSALLEAMQERQVSVANETRALPSPFLVLATQNPVDQEGTYALPEAQVDRVMLKVCIDYPSKEAEREIVARMASLKSTPRAEQVATPEQLLAARDLVDAVHVDERLIAYVVDVVGATRDPGSIGLAELKPMILYGGSPRASIALTRAARARAFLDRQAFVGPEHIKRVALGVLQHRVITTYEAEAEGLRSVDVIERILDAVPIP